MKVYTDAEIYAPRAKLLVKQHLTKSVVLFSLALQLVLIVELTAKNQTIYLNIS